MLYIFSLLDKNQISTDQINNSNKILDKVDSILGVIIEKDIALPDEINLLIKQREEARKNKDWALSDKIRNQLKDKDVLLEDTPDGTIWKINK